MKSINAYRSITLFLAVLFFLASKSVTAEVASLSCDVGVEIAHYDPGITNIAKPTTITSKALATACIGIPLGITNATIELTGSGMIGCEASTSDDTYEILWSDRTSSTVQTVSDVTQRPAGQIIIIENGLITSGRFAGGTVVRTLTLLQTDLAGCSSPEGVLSAGGPATLTLTSLL